MFEGILIGIHEVLQASKAIAFMKRCRSFNISTACYFDEGRVFVLILAQIGKAVLGMS